MSRILNLTCLCLLRLTGVALSAATSTDVQPAAMLSDLAPQQLRTLTVNLLNQLPSAAAPGRLQEPSPWAQPTDVQFTAMAADALARQPNVAASDQLKPAQPIQEPKQ